MRIVVFFILVFMSGLVFGQQYNALSIINTYRQMHGLPVFFNAGKDDIAQKILEKFVRHNKPDSRRSAYTEFYVFNQEWPDMALIIDSGKAGSWYYDDQLRSVTLAFRKEGRKVYGVALFYKE